MAVHGKPVRTEASRVANLKNSIVLCVCLLLPVQALFSAEEEPFRRRLSLKLTGGGGFALIGSVNRSLRLLNNNETFEKLRENDPGSISGEIRGLNNWLVDWEIELRMDLNRKWSIGVAVSAPYQDAKESSLSYAMYENEQRGPRVETLLYRTEAKASVPIKLNFYYSPRYWKNSKLMINWGVGLYPARISQYWSSSVDNVLKNSDDWEVTAKIPWGLHFGLSLEYPLSKDVFLAMDVQARYVLLRNLKGRKEGIGSDGAPFEYEGTLVLLEASSLAIPAFYEILRILPESGPYARPAYFDLTGIVLRLGIRVPLF
jgi:hypothetical protein